MKKIICKHLESRIKEIKTRAGIFHVNEYKCNKKGGAYYQSKRIICENCPLQLSLF